MKVKVRATNGEQFEVKLQNMRIIVDLENGKSKEFSLKPSRDRSIFSITEISGESISIEPRSDNTIIVK